MTSTLSPSSSGSLDLRFESRRGDMRHVNPGRADSKRGDEQVSRAEQFVVSAGGVGQQLLDFRVRRSSLRHAASMLIVGQVPSEVSPWPD